MSNDSINSTQLFGHNYILEDILKMLHTNTLHNSIIFSGKKGVGKYSYIINLAKFLLSHTVDELRTINNFSINPKVSATIDSGACAEFLLITPEFDEKKQAFKEIISVDEIRKINNFLRITTQENKYKIVIIDATDNLNVNASNALLKNLEEPTKNTLFFLISHNFDNLLDTIKSRCINLKFKDLSHNDMINILNSRGISYSNEEINNLILLANGSYADLLWYLEPTNFKIYLGISGIFNSQAKDIEIYDLVNTIKSQENVNYKIIFNILKNLLIVNINANNIDDISTILEKINYLSKVSDSLHLDKSVVLLDILFKIKSSFAK